MSQFDCNSCKYLSQDNTCDMCEQGYPHVKDNNGKKPKEVTTCNVYMPRKKPRLKICDSLKKLGKEGNNLWVDLDSLKICLIDLDNIDFKQLYIYLKDLWMHSSEHARHEFPLSVESNDLYNLVTVIGGWTIEANGDLVKTKQVTYNFSQKDITTIEASRCFLKQHYRVEEILKAFIDLKIKEKE